MDDATKERIREKIRILAEIRRENDRAQYFDTIRKKLDREREIEMRIWREKTRKNLNKIRKRERKKREMQEKGDAFDEEEFEERWRIIDEKKLDIRVIEEYDKRFSFTDIAGNLDGKNERGFMKGRITPEIANAYDLEFTAGDVFWLGHNDVPPEYAHTLRELFSAQGISHIYAARMSTKMVFELVHELGLSEGEWNLLVAMKNVPLELIKKYTPRFKSREIVELFSDGISSETAKAYDERLDGEQICKYWSNKITPELSRQLRDVFSNPLEIVLSGISPEELVKLSRIRSAKNIEEIVDFFKWRKKQITLAELPASDLRFDKDEIVKLFESEISAQVANSYNHRFSVEDIIVFCKGKRDYSSRLRSPYWRDVAPQRIEPSIAERYHLRFSAEEIASFQYYSIDPDQANIHSLEISARRIINRSLLGIGINGHPLEDILSEDWIESFANFELNAELILRMLKLGYSLKTISGIPEITEILVMKDIVDFGVEEDLRKLFSVVADLMEKFSDQVPRDSRHWLLTLGIMPDTLPVEDQVKKAELLAKLGDPDFTPHEATYFTYGGESIIFVSKGGVHKASLGIEEEYQVLMKIHNYHGKAGASHIISPIDKPKYGFILPLRKINGKNISAIVKESMSETAHRLDLTDILNISSDILDGLVEMRSAGVIHHRDVRPENVLVGKIGLKSVKRINLLADDDGIIERDEYYGKYVAIIIDFGIASTDRNASYIRNRRFGAVEGQRANDLISLGQVMYYMAIGRHIFDESRSMVMTFKDAADEIKDYRTRVYLEPRLLDHHLKQVDTDIEDPILRNLIKLCLTAKPYYFRRMQRKFKETIRQYQQSQEDLLQ